MKIALFADIAPAVHWNPLHVLNFGLGSTHVSTWGLARVLHKMGHNVAVWGYINTPDIYDGVEYRDLQTDSETHEYDTVIGIQSLPDGSRIRADNKVVWFRHGTEFPDLSVYDYDTAVVRSKYHRHTLKDAGVKLPTRTYVIPDGVADEYFSAYDERNRKRTMDVVFVGHPVRGLGNLPEIAKKIHDINPDIRIHAYGNALLWGWDNEQKQLQDLYQDLIKQGVLYHGRRGLREIAGRLVESKIFLYPCGLETTFGLAVCEAMACGVVPITTGQGNLPNIVEPHGIVSVDGTDDFAWTTKITNDVIKLYNDQGNLRFRSAACHDDARNYTWDRIGKQWENKLS